VNGVAIAQFTVKFFANGNYTLSAEYMGTPSFQGECEQFRDS
jgi:hypothetical protein